MAVAGKGLRVLSFSLSLRKPVLIKLKSGSRSRSGFFSSNSESLRLLNCSTTLMQNSARAVSTISTAAPVSSSKDQEKSTLKAVTISRAMRAYMERARAHDDMMNAEVADYEIGKRHLANIMGKDPDNFTQEDVDKAVEYLLPSGLFDKKARPLLKNPYEIFPKRKAAQFGLDGRPYHWMYFTTLPNYYNVLYEITWKLEGLKVLEDRLRAESKFEDERKPLNLVSSVWISFLEFKKRLVESIQDKEYNHFVVMMERLASHPLAYKEEEFIMSFRSILHLASQSLEPPKVEVDAEGRMFATAQGVRKNAKATVTVYRLGTGKFSINNTDLRYFKDLLYRESIMFPLSLTNMMGEVDVVAETYDGGLTGQAGAIRFALSRALSAFVSEEKREQMRLAGILTRDLRVKERKKPGQEKARKKFTWKKR